MCYNSDCRIEIKSCIDGSESNVSAHGKVEKTINGYRFDYFLDGDQCTLIVDGDEIVQSRRGEQNIKMTFRKGEQTDCFLENYGFSGVFSAFTHDLQCTMRDINSGFGTNQIFKLIIIYTTCEQKIKLEFSAEYKV